MRAVRALACLALLARAAPAAAVPDGPLGVATPGTFRALFLEMPLSDARTAGGRGRLDVRWWLANDWSIPTRLSKGSHVVWVQQDEQADVLQLSATVPWSRLAGWSWAERWRTSAEIRLVEHWGGWTDAGIEHWHAATGSWNFLREHYARDAVHLRLAEEGGRTLADVHHARPALSDLALRTQGLLAQGTPRPGGAVPWALALRADLKLPTGRLAVLGGSGGVDAGLGLTSTLAPATWLTLHAQGALRLVSPLPHGFPLQPEPLQWGLDLSAVVRFRDRVALVLEDRLSSRLFRGGWALRPDEKEPEATAYYGLFRPYNQISVGLRAGEVTVHLSEDFTPGKRLPTDTGAPGFYNSNSPDVMLGLAWAHDL